MKQPLYGAIASSADETEISNRVKGIVLAASSLIIYFAAHLFGVQLTATDISSLATSFGIIAGAIWTIWGAILAMVRFFGTKRV